MTDDLKPALTPDEWNMVLEACDDNGCASADVATAAMHGLFPAAAAIALCRQPFGFTHEDVDRIRNEDDPWVRERLGSIADRIEALLPPRPSPDR